MTIEELAEELHLKENYIKTHWNRIVDNYSRIGIYLEKRGWGKSAEYGIQTQYDVEMRWHKRGDKSYER